MNKIVVTSVLFAAAVCSSGMGFAQDVNPLTKLGVITGATAGGNNLAAQRDENGQILRSIRNPALGNPPGVVTGVGTGTAGQVDGGLVGGLIALAIATDDDDEETTDGD